ASTCIFRRRPQALRAAPDPELGSGKLRFGGTRSEPMKLTYEKITQLSHRIIGAIEALDEIEIFEEPNTIRLEVVKILNDLAAEDEKIEATVRQHITSQKRTIPEGSVEWDI